LTNAIAMPSPMPLAPPVINATFPSTFSIIHSPDENWPESIKTHKLNDIKKKHAKDHTDYTEFVILKSLESVQSMAFF
jgi:hypothetical protein